MTNLGDTLIETATAVAAVAGCQGDVDALDDASVLGAMQLVRDNQRALDGMKLLYATTIARRSDHTLGYDGLARKNGAATPTVLIQNLTGSSLDDARTLAHLGQLAVDSEAASEPDAVVVAIAELGISLDSAEAIRSGLGRPDEAVTAEQLAEATAVLLAQAGGVSPEVLRRMARQARADLDIADVERGEKERAAMRYVRKWRKDGFSQGSWRLPLEEGGVELDAALDLILGDRIGGPRVSFPATDANGLPVDEPVAIVDPRTNDEILADGFVQIIHAGITADQSIVPASQRAAVKVIVTQQVLDAGVGYGILEDSLSPISWAKLEQWLCEAGTASVVVDAKGNPIDIGAEQRLFTRAQRAAMGVRDGGCRFPGCTKPPAATEAHHVKHWKRDKGKTTLVNGILLCRYHHMLMHNHWEISRIDDMFWLRPPASYDKNQALIAMPSRNPLMRR
jgi:hypothetical protein